MAKLNKIAIGIGILVSPVGCALAANAASDEVCYDRAVIGRFQYAENFAGLDQFVQAEPNEVMLGGRWNVRIAVDKVIAGNSTPTDLNARVVLTTMFRPKARCSFF
ncbi:MAG: hypothetical protein ACREEO_09470 [Phenylobacterium sp.]